MSRQWIDAVGVEVRAPLLDDEHALAEHGDGIQLVDREVGERALVPVKGHGANVTRVSVAW